jgi:hypothetical protein
MACSSTCPTQDHPSLGACIRDKGVRVGWANSASGLDATSEKKWDKDLDFYRDARRQGVQPSGTSRDQVDRAMRISEATGTAFSG